VKCAIPDCETPEREVSDRPDGVPRCGYHRCVALGARARARGKGKTHRKGWPLDEPMRPELVEALARSRRSP
jgi:hypothetical protein